MKNTTKLIATGFAAFTLAGAAYSQTTIVNITGATAFRAAANTSIIALLGGAGTTEYTFDTTTGASAGATNRAIYRGTVTGIPGTVIVRASWSGSTAGIAAVAAGPLRGAKALSYNGVTYSEDAVKNGAYSLWGYQWLYQAPSITASETTFKSVFLSTIPANLGSAAIPIPTMNVTRSGGDGGPILPQ